MPPPVYTNSGLNSLSISCCQHEAFMYSNKWPLLMLIWLYWFPPWCQHFLLQLGLNPLRTPFFLSSVVLLYVHLLSFVVCTSLQFEPFLSFPLGWNEAVLCMHCWRLWLSVDGMSRLPTFYITPLLISHSMSLHQSLFKAITLMHVLFQIKFSFMIIILTASTETVLLSRAKTKG